MSHAPQDVALAFVEAINRQDVDALTELMTPNHSFTDSLGHKANGREVMRQGWKLYFQMVPDYHLEIAETYVQDSSVVFLGNASGTYAHAVEDAGAMGMPNQMRDGSSRNNQRWKTPAAVRAVIEDGKVAEWRVYADNEPLRRLMKQSG